MYFLTLDEAIDDFVDRIHENLIHDAYVSREDLNKRIRDALTHNMVFEFWRLSPLKAPDGTVFMKDGKHVG